MKNLKTIVSFIAIITLIACKKNDIKDSASNNPTIEGTWVRLPGPSGDRTDLAIGGITGQPINRVYMCEKKGSTAAGFYKGMYSNNAIIWDAVYGLPNFSVRLVGNELELDCDVCLPTKYKQGAWSGECGPIVSKTHNIAVGFNSADPNLSNVTAIELFIVDEICPFTLLNSIVTSPDCSNSNAFITVNESQMNFSGMYTVLINYTSGGIKHSESSPILNSDLTNQCNLFTFFRNGPTGNIFLKKM